MFSGFSLGSTIKSHTKGIWIWARTHPQNPDQYLVLLDTEGLGDVEKVHTCTYQKIDTCSDILCMIVSNCMSCYMHDMHLFCTKP